MFSRDREPNLHLAGFTPRCGVGPRLTRTSTICTAFSAPSTAPITDYLEFDPALAGKFTIYRRMPSASPGDADIFGSQQYGRSSASRSREAEALPRGRFELGCGGGERTMSRAFRTTPSR
jgi:Domain of unknown function (DUF4387)